MKNWFTRHDKKFFLWASFALLLISALAYLPKLGVLGYYNDDWYLVYDAYTQGPSIYHEVFRIDRPLRAYTMIASYHLFGLDPVLYNLSAYFFRFLSSLGFLWTLQLLWPKQKTSILGMTALFLLYPGFLSQYNGIDYQSQMISLAFAFFSIALTLKAILTRRKFAKTAFFLASLILGWIYLGLVEYFIGFEVLRFAAIFVLAARKKKKLREKIFITLQQSWGFLLIAGAFLVWNIFFFENERKATSVTAQFGQLFSSPVHTGLWWFVYLLQGLLDVLLLTWAVPFRALVFNLRLRDFMVGAGLAILVAALTALILFWLNEEEDNPEKTPAQKTNWQTEALLLGIFSAAGGILPIIMVNRHLDFFAYSRYTLGGSAGSVIAVVAFLFFLKKKAARFSFLAVLVFIATFTHFGNATKLAINTEATNEFWWQMSWRAPQIKEGTTLVVEYPNGEISEDYIVWGAANLLYYPEIPKNIPLETPLSGLVLTPEHVNRIQTTQGETSSNGRGYNSHIDFDNVLIATQSGSGSCVRILDAAQPELSSFDSYRIQLVAPYSNGKSILADEKPTIPASEFFGTEPNHQWCYFYQKASLARQQGKWDEVISLMEKALDEGFYPADSIEWMPLLEAYANTGQEKKLRPYVSIINAEPLLTSQACSILSNAAQTEEMQTYIEKKFCE
jgi:hypothetical protein